MIMDIKKEILMYMTIIMGLIFKSGGCLLEYGPLLE